MSYPLTISDPLDIAPAAMTSTVPEDEYSAWAIDATYNLGGRVLHEHSVWECMQDGNLAHEPGVADESWWVRVSASNRWALLDLRNDTPTRSAGGMSYTFTPGLAIDVVHLIGLADCDTVRVWYDDPVEGIVFDTQVVAVGRIVEKPEWWYWCYGVPTTQRTLHSVGLPTYPNATLHIDIVGGADCAVTYLLIGRSYAWGIGVQYGFRQRSKDVSTRERDKWGALTLKEGARWKQQSFVLMIENHEMDALGDFLDTRSARVMLWTCSTQWETTRLLGFLATWDLLIAYYNYSDVDFEIEGVTAK